MAREFAVEDTVCNKAEKAGWLVRKLAYPNRRNGPDRFFAKGGRFLMIEFKDIDGPTRQTQLNEHRRLREAGIEVHVCKAVDSALKVLGIA